MLLKLLARDVVVGEGGEPEALLVAVAALAAAVRGRFFFSGSVRGRVYYEVISCDWC